MSSVSALRPKPGAHLERDGATTLDAVLSVVRPRARRLALLMERAWAAGRTSPDQGLAITASEVAWLLAGEEVLREERAIAVADPLLAELAQEANAAQAMLARDRAWARLVQAFALDADEAAMLMLLVAVEAEPSLQRVIAYLHDDARLVQPTPALSLRLSGRERRVWPAANLLRWRLAAPLDDAPAHALAGPWRIDPAVMLALHDGAWRDPRIAGALAMVADDAAIVPLQSAALAALRDAGDPCHVALTGPRGSGRQTLAVRFAAERGQPLLVADLALLTAQGLEPGDAIARVLRHAAFSGALAYFRDAETASSAAWAMARGLGVPFLRGTRSAGSDVVAIPLAPLQLDERLALWAALSAAPPPAMLGSQRLTPAEIDRLARGGAAPRPERPDHGLLARLPCPYDWDDLILPGDTARQLSEFTDQVRLRWNVYDGWGYRHLAHMGFGIAALFGGPSGTGKTMAAQVIARSLGLDLYRVDLAGVINKYVGETEKKLREVFDACEDSGALLFFDEADALFGGRMQANTAHDRFANIETNYLLQRIETFDGVVILATNRRDEIDDAFIRRLRFIVDFLPPQAPERMTLWRRALRAQSPGGEALLGEIDWPLLAEQLAMTGAAIKNTALSAAFLAHGEGARIGMDHILHAAHRELAKQHEKLPPALRRRDVR